MTPRITSCLLVFLFSVNNAMAMPSGNGKFLESNISKETYPVIPHQQTAWIRAQVVDVNTQGNSVLLRTNDGLTVLPIDASIERLAHVRKNDWLDVRYETALKLSIGPSDGIRERVTSRSATIEDQGRPANFEHIEETIKSEVLIIDHSSNSILVRGARGNIHWLKVLDEEIINSASTQQQLVIWYKAALTVRFQPAENT
ncbi:MAG TPA: hypothetical protein PLR92_00345 [Alicycliphilus denitrificans]|nr:hypothetical protein [Alicycliphilus denitrificans]